MLRLILELVPVTVTTGNSDPYEGFEDGTQIGGRGVSDQLGGIVIRCMRRLKS